MLYTLRSNELYVTEHWVVGSIAMLLIPQSYVFDVVGQCFRGNWAALLLLCHTDLTDLIDISHDDGFIVGRILKVYFHSSSNNQTPLFTNKERCLQLSS